MTPNGERVLCRWQSPAKAGGVSRPEIRDRGLLQEGGDVEIVVVDLEGIALADLRLAGAGAALGGLARVLARAAAPAAAGVIEARPDHRHADLVAIDSS